MKVPFVDLKAQYDSIKKEIDQTIRNVLNNTAFIGGEEVEKFCDNFSKYIGVQYTTPVGNGTDALFISLKALGIGNGDEVITAANTFVATSEAITASGAKVVFADCHPDYYTIDPKLLEQKITKRTKAIIPVHLYGQPAMIEDICNIAQKYDLYVIEDSAQAHGAKYNDKKVGTFGDLAIFSFYPGKNLGAYGDAGAIVTNSKELATLCRKLANHGRIDKYDHEIEGYNSRMDGIQAAVLNVKLKHIEKWNRRRRQAAQIYDNLLENVDEVITPKICDKTLPVYHLYVIRAKNRDDLQKFLKEQGISTGVHYPIGLPFLKAYEYLGHRPEDFPVTYKYQSDILSLPIYPEITEEMITYVVDKIKYFYAKQ